MELSKAARARTDEDGRSCSTRQLRPGSTDRSPSVASLSGGAPFIRVPRDRACDPEDQYAAQPAGSDRSPSCIAERRKTVAPDEVADHDSWQTQFRKVVRFRSAIATQHLRYATGPNSRTMTAPCVRTSLVVMTPLIAIAAWDAFMSATLGIRTPRNSPDPTGAPSASTSAGKLWPLTRSRCDSTHGGDPAASSKWMTRTSGDVGR